MRKQATQPSEAGFSLDFDRLLADPVGSAESLENQLHTYRRFIGSVEGPLQQAKIHVALANWLLAIPAAKPATRWLLDMEQPEDLHKIAWTGQEAGKHLQKASALLSPLKTDPAGESQKRLQSAIETLEPFLCSSRCHCTFTFNVTNRFDSCFCIQILSPIMT